MPTSTPSSCNFAESINPATGEKIAHYPYESVDTIDAMLDVAHAAFRRWSAMPVERRAQAIGDIAKVLRRETAALAWMATREMGKPISQAIAEIEKCAVLCDWYAEHGPALVRDEPTTIGPNAYVSYLPMGPVLAVMPWNFPFWQILRGAIPILLGGNVYVLKHAPNVMGCAYLLRDLFLAAGLPEGVLTVINVTPDVVSHAIRSDKIAAIAVTGSVRAGSAIAAQAGAVLKKCVLELGGSDPFIVLADADVERAVQAAVIGRFQNTGQICIAAKRIILEEPIADEFTKRFLDSVGALKVGDPESPDTYIGPMARADLRDELDCQVRQTVREGGHLLMGGECVGAAGNFYAPTIIADVRPGMTAFREETFGPVAALVRAKNVEDAIALANDSEYGLSGALWTQDKQLAAQLARRVETGGMFINGFSASDPRIPIGGVKKSGFGRELSHFGVTEFLNAQAVWIDRVT